MFPVFALVVSELFEERVMGVRVGATAEVD